MRKRDEGPARRTDEADNPDSLDDAPPELTLAHDPSAPVEPGTLNVHRLPDDDLEDDDLIEHNGLKRVDVDDEEAEVDDAESEETAEAQSESVSPLAPAMRSPARARASDQTVKRATSGLIRLDARRRVKTYLRRSLYLALLAAPIAALIYFFAEDIVDVLLAYWERIESKMPPAGAAEVPRR